MTTLDLWFSLSFAHIHSSSSSSCTFWCCAPMNLNETKRNKMGHNQNRQRETHVFKRRITVTMNLYHTYLAPSFSLLLLLLLCQLQSGVPFCHRNISFFSPPKKKNLKDLFNRSIKREKNGKNMAKECAAEAGVKNEWNMRAKKKLPKIINKTKV